MAIPTVVPRDTRSAFGDWLRERRKVLGFSQEEVAKRASLTRQQWIRLEAGESGTRRETIPRIALALAVSMEEASRRAGFEPHPESETDETFVRDIERLLNRFPNPVRSQVKDNVRRYTESLMSLLVGA